ncbi:molybdopterin-containing oxidoreductase family membrane subunit [Desulfosalsimonas propionicica]|uniref:Molybdopterin-containing oxidoreductase family membrane subunit n=1 Tax=Desulfosalsimonas propionicica TaxID=332175 RepID=A0A7W0HL90_9BACT|nr:NrfD/PsrC family molybdoenzyme membrane anchor subunit [Desulfosalsimonas propionicica]MBA2881856.1 molybdopterin-containing oxidoreductase family membrane subunit [Desulfosalsimonas propionicica]
MAASKTFTRAWTLLLILGLALGLFAALTSIFAGLGVYNTRNVVFWGLPMAGYLFFGLTAAGLTLLSSLPTVFGAKHLYPVAKRAALLAFATLLAGLMCKGLDLGPISTLTNLIWIAFSPNLTSPIWWMTILYAFYFAFVAFKFLTMHQGKWHRVEGVFAAIGALLLSFFSYLSLSVVFGTVQARLGFFGFTLGLYFLVTAFASGLAALLLSSVINDWLKGSKNEQEIRARSDLSLYLGISLGATLVVFLLRIIRAFAAQTEQMAGFMHMMGSLSFNVELIAGILVPLGILAFAALRKNAAAQFAAAVLVLIGMFAGRFEQLLSGNVQPMGVQAEGAPEFIHYVPSIYEWGIILLVLSIVLTIYTLAERYLDLGAAPEEA